MKRSQALGHCICDVRLPCPCDVFKEKSICHCAGETVPCGGGPVRLTQHVRNVGCASKISKSVLDEVLAGLPQVPDPRVIVGSSAGDDAGVIMLSADVATILTVDVFCPAVDDPYTFGQIAAANSLSDIYAMGGTPQVALSIIGFPIHALPASAMREILRGGVEKMNEAGVPVIGGHSINDEEVKCGFAVVGTSRPDAFVRNSGARIGDRIILTKPLGSGILAFANQLGRAPAPAMAAAARSMASLNRVAGEAMVHHGAHAATDVTGFSLMGHLAEIVRNSNVRVDLQFDQIPLFDGVLELAKQDVLPGAVERNRESVSSELLDLEQLSAAEQSLLFGPETSGGLLVFIAQGRVDPFLADLKAGGVDGHLIGSVTSECTGGCIHVTASAPACCCGSVSTIPRAIAAFDVADTDVHAAMQSTGGCCEHVSELPTAETASLPAPAAADAFRAYQSAVNSPGALDLVQKKLIALALSVASKCEPCVTINVKAARAAGASEPQISEAVAMGISFGGASVAMFYNTLRNRTQSGGGG